MKTLINTTLGKLQNGDIFRFNDDKVETERIVTKTAKITRTCAIVQFKDVETVTCSNDREVTLLRTVELDQYLKEIKPIVIVTFPKVTGLIPTIQHEDIKYATLVWNSEIGFCVNTVSLNTNDDGIVNAYIKRIEKISEIAFMLNDYVHEMQEMEMRHQQIK